ncbi:MAG: spore cortex biosynthesis protein YabQ [Eubacteriales bacterium]
MDITYALSHYLIFASLLIGVVCGAVYDVFRILRVFTPKNAFLVFAEDLIYCLFVAAALMILFYNYTEGRIRFWAFAGVAGGFSAYYFTVGTLTRRAVKAAAALVLKFYKALKLRVSRAGKAFYRAAYMYNRIRSARRRAKNGFGF